MASEVGLNLSGKLNFGYSYKHVSVNTLSRMDVCALSCVFFLARIWQRRLGQMLSVTA